MFSLKNILVSSKGKLFAFPGVYSLRNSHVGFNLDIASPKKSSLMTSSLQIKYYYYVLTTVYL